MALGDGRWRLFISTARRWLFAGDPAGALQALEVDAGGAAGPAENAWPAAPVPFRPLGLSFLPAAGLGNGTLYVVDTGSSRPCIWRLEIAGGRIAGSASAITSPALGNANNLLALDDGSIVVSNTPSLRLWPAGAAPPPPLALIAPSGEVVAIDHTPRFANGIAAMPDGRGFVVADYRGRRLLLYERRAGGLQLRGRLPVEGAPDNLTTDPERPTHLYVAVQESILRSLLHLASNGRIASPSRVFRLDLAAEALLRPGSTGVRGTFDAGGPTEIWADDGNLIGAASVALRLDRHLLVGQIVRPGVAICPFLGDAGDR